MKLSLIKKISREDAAKSGEPLPKWYDAVFTPINDFIEKVALALQGNLTFADNFLCKVVQIDFIHAVEISINPLPVGSKNLRVIGVIPIASGGLGIDSFKWTYKSDGSVGVTFQFDGGISTTSANCTIIILLG
jgi:hypothetical protein